MKTAFIITSIIEVDNSWPLTYSNTRSFFNSQERLRQTVFTVNCVDRVVTPADTLFLLDASPNSTYENYFSYQKNLKYIDIKTHFPEIHQEVTTHPHKSRCESLLLIAFMEKFAKDLSQYDVVYKISGRYFFDSSFVLPEITDNIYFKIPQRFEWNDAWGLQYLDCRSIQQDNTLRQYSTVLFGWGSKHNTVMLDIFKKIAETVIEPGKSNSDMETLIYFFTRSLESHIIEYDWCVYGWNGTNGNFLRF